MNTDSSYLTEMKKSSKACAGISHKNMKTSINDLTVKRTNDLPNVLNRISSLDKWMGVIALLQRGAHRFFVLNFITYKNKFIVRHIGI